MAKERGARSRQRRRGRGKKEKGKWEGREERRSESRDGHEEWAMFCCVCGNMRRIRDFALSPCRVWLCFKPGLKHSCHRHRRCYRSCLLQTLHRQLMNDFLFHLNFDFSLFFCCCCCCCWLCGVITRIWLIDKRKINMNNRDIICYYCCTKKRQTDRQREGGGK